MKRIALVSTPRSGNTWLRMILSRLYNLNEYAIHFPDFMSWDNLPTECIVQIHWHPDEHFLNLLKKEGFSTVTIARHPYDVLLSILQFCPKEPQTASWLQGEGGDEKNIFNVTPSSQAFHSYVLSKRALALLSVSAEWWKFDDTTKIKYENLVHNPQEELYFILNKFGEFSTPLETVLNELTIEKLRVSSTNGHFWQGKIGLWEHLFPYSLAKEADEYHQEVFNVLGYSCKREEIALSGKEIDDFWKNLRI